MKNRIKTVLCLSALTVAVVLIPFSRASGHTFTNLHNFSGVADGLSPAGGVIVSGNRLFGTTSASGSEGDTVFAMNADGSAFTNLHNFSDLSYNAANNNYTNRDGFGPYCDLILAGSTLYGTTAAGGNFGSGTLFSIATNGVNFTVLHHFSLFVSNINDQGASPRGGLVLAGRTLFGTASSGGSAGSGTVFSIVTNGTGFTVLKTFPPLVLGTSFYTNSDGANLLSGLLLSGKTLYGVATIGGNGGSGTVFKVDTNGTGFATLHHFPVLAGTYPSTNSQGASPSGPLVLSGSTLFGSASSGGNDGTGTLFSVRTNGSGFATLHHFSSVPVFPAPYINEDGFIPSGGLILSNNTLFGSAQRGGANANGTIFSVLTNGTGFSNLFSFEFAGDPPLTNSTGVTPSGGLFLVGEQVYGTAISGGTSGYGTVFRLTLDFLGKPELTIRRAATNIVLTWSTNFPGFTLQSTTNLVTAPTWSAVSPSPVVFNGQNTVTNPTSGTVRFYRLFK